MALLRPSIPRLTTRWRLLLGLVAGAGCAGANGGQSRPAPAVAKRPPAGSVTTLHEQLQASLERQSDLERRVEDLSSQLYEVQERNAPRSIEIRSGARRAVAIRPTPEGYRSQSVDDTTEEAPPPPATTERPSLSIDGSRVRYDEPGGERTRYKLTEPTPAPKRPQRTPPAHQPLIPTDVVAEGSTPPPPAPRAPAPVAGPDRLVAKAAVPPAAAAARGTVSPPAAPPVAAPPVAAKVETPRPAPVPRTRPTPEAAPLPPVGEAVVRASEPAARSERPVEPASHLAQGEVPDRYREALDLLRKGQHEPAMAVFRGIVADHPRHDLADNAQYWLGEAYYDQKDFDRASVEFKRVIDRFPKGNKVPDALYKLALCHAQRNQTQAAKAALEKLLRSYPKAEVAKKARDRLGTLRGA